jgi:DNA (cytosine-5)-methyltransferase 1
VRFVDLFAGMGGFHRALTSLGHECVFASEIDDELKTLYWKNFPASAKLIHGDIRGTKDKIPPHDILCAGFPCQPFSKSGSQNGRRDRTRGTLFHEIVEITRRHKPRYLILENVGNFERHNRGRTWKVVRETLENLQYDVRGTTHKTSGGHGLISPHHLGFPHTRERFFIVASREKLTADPFPVRDKTHKTSLAQIVQGQDKLSLVDHHETSLSQSYVDCINHWNKLLKLLPPDLDLPSFPIWGDEIQASYPFEESTPYSTDSARLLSFVRHNGATLCKDEMLALLPSYARMSETQFPEWKVRFIRQNREWFQSIRQYLPEDWVVALERFPSSLRKLEWNCKGEKRDLWEHVLQFRPSGLRAKRYATSPALVAMTTTQIPILGPERRFLTRVEGLRLQGFPDTHLLPKARAQAFAALGNAVHVGVVRAIASAVLKQHVS